MASADLPPIDDFRRPFIEPLGCLTLLAAQCDQAVINIVALGQAGSWKGTNERVFAEASEVTRHWKPSAIDKAVAALSLADEVLRQTVDQCLRRYSALRTKRHRAIHDALIIGYDHHYGAVAVAVGYQKAGGQTTTTMGPITPDDIAALARDFSTLHVELVHCLTMYRRAEMAAQAAGG